jgi:hypothetical protein
MVEANTQVDKGLVPAIQKQLKRRKHEMMLGEGVALATDADNYWSFLSVENLTSMRSMSRGNRLASLIFDKPKMCMVILSAPKANPPNGGTPYLKDWRYNSTSSSLMPQSLRFDLMWS